MSNACSNPSWSNHCHHIVPVMMLVVRDPWNPFIILSPGITFPTKWAGLSEIQAVPRLSTPIIAHCAISVKVGLIVAGWYCA
jgi:hypothetical protein